MKRSGQRDRCALSEIQVVGDGLNLVLQRCHGASRAVGSVAVIVDAKKPDIATFYARYGLSAFPNSPLHVFLPMKTISTLAGS